MKAWRLSRKQILGVVVLFIVVYFIYGILLPPVTTLTTTRSLTLSLNQTLFIRVYNGTTTALKLHSLSATGAVFYVSKLPILYHPLISFSLSPLSSVNVSSYGSSLADMNVELISSGVGSATLQLTPLQAALGIRPSAGLTIKNPGGLGGAQNASNSNSLLTTTSTTMTTTSTVQNTTAALLQRALTLITQAGIGTLMNNYNALYAKDVDCNETTYNSTYRVYHHIAPPPPVSFANVSTQTPTGINVSEQALPQPSNVRITYSTISPSPDTTGPVLIAIINTSSPSFLRNVTFTGIYTGLNTLILNNSYTFQSRILNDCGAYVPPP